MSTVTIDTVVYDVYADVTEADVYLDAALHADTWRSTATTTKARALVTATRLLDRQIWKGVKLDIVYQTLQFPRTNMGISGLDDSAGVTPDGIVMGSIELALALLDGSDVQNQQNTSERIRSMSAGSVSISNFRGVDLVKYRFPQIVQELIGPYLGSVDTSFGPRATGTDKCSVFPGNYGFTKGL